MAAKTDIGHGRDFNSQVHNGGKVTILMTTLFLESKRLGEDWPFSGTFVFFYYVSAFFLCVLFDSKEKIIIFARRKGTATLSSPECKSV